MSYDLLERKRAVVVVKAFWGSAGRDPLGVELAAGTEPATTEAWEREADRWLRWIKICKQNSRKFDKNEFVREHPLPDWWCEMAGDIPGLHDPILGKEVRWGRKFYQSGDIRTQDIPLNKPSLV